jgi:hypothetical protein
MAPALPDAGCDVTAWREGVVQQLTRLLTDGDLDMFRDADATAQEREIAAQVFRRMIVFTLQDAGVIRDNTSTVLDVTMRQAWAIANVWDVCRRWDSCDPDRTVGAMLKTLPADDVEKIQRVLVEGGLATVAVGDDGAPAAVDT